MTEVPFILRIMISLAEELEDRIGETEETLDGLRAQIAAIQDSKIRSTSNLDALYKELWARAVAMRVLRDEDHIPDEEPAAVVERIREAFSEDNKVTASDVIALDSWRRSPAKTRLMVKSPVPEMEQIEEQADAPPTLEDALDRVLATLTPREERIIRATYGYGTPYDNGQLVDHQRWLQRVTASTMGLSQPAVSQIHAKALRKLKHPSRSHQLRRYADSIPRTGASRAQVIIHMIFGEHSLV